MTNRKKKRIFNLTVFSMGLVVGYLSLPQEDIVAEICAMAVVCLACKFYIK